MAKGKERYEILFEDMMDKWQLFGEGLQAHGARFDRVEERIGRVEQSVKLLREDVVGRFDALEKRYDGRFDALEQRYDGRFDRLEREITAISKFLQQYVEQTDRRLNRLEKTA